MKYTFILLLSCLLVSCNDQSSSINRSTILTSTVRENAPFILFNGEMSNYHSPVRFSPDGTYSLGEPGSRLKGKWKWVDENTILLTLTSITGDGYTSDFPKTTEYHLNIKKLTQSEFSYIVKGEETFFGKEEETNLIARVD